MHSTPCCTPSFPHNNPDYCVGCRAKCSLANCQRGWGEKKKKNNPTAAQDVFWVQCKNICQNIIIYILNLKKKGRKIQFSLGLTEFACMFQVDFNTLPEDVKGLAQDGCRALLEQQYHGAERAFSQLLSILYTPGFLVKSPKFPSLCQ